MKTCKTCQETKPLTDFYAQKGVKDGRASKCKTCHKAHSKAYLQVNREKHCQAMLKNYYKTKEQRAAYRKVYYAKNKETILQKAKMKRAQLKQHETN
jgi:hypothetical protein